MISIVFRNVLRNKRRSFLTVLGILIGVAAIISLVSVSIGLGERSAKVLSSFQGILVLEKGAIDIPYSKVDESWGEKIARVPGVKIVTPEIWGNARNIGEAQGNAFAQMLSNFIFVVGIDPNKAGDYEVAPYYRVDKGRRLTSSDRHSVIIGSGLADMFDLFVGSTMKINGENYQLVGIFNTETRLGNFIVVTNLETAREVVSFDEGKVSAFQAIPNNPEDLGAVKERINSRFSGVLNAVSMQDSAEIITSFIGGLNTALWLISGIAGLVGGIGVMNTMLMSVMERIKEFGMLKAIGWRNRDVMIMIVLESVVLGFVGGLLGIGLGFFVSTEISRLTDLASMVTLELIVQAMFFALVMGLVGGIYPAYKSSKMSPVEAVRS